MSKNISVSVNFIVSVFRYIFYFILLFFFFLTFSLLLCFYIINFIKQIVELNWTLDTIGPCDKSVDPDQTPILWRLKTRRLIYVYIVCSDLQIPNFCPNILRVYTVDPK